MPATIGDTNFEQVFVALNVGKGCFVIGGVYILHRSSRITYSSHCESEVE